MSLDTFWIFINCCSTDEKEIVFEKWLQNRHHLCVLNGSNSLTQFLHRCECCGGLFEESFPLDSALTDFYIVHWINTFTLCFRKSQPATVRTLDLCARNTSGEYKTKWWEMSTGEGIMLLKLILNLLVFLKAKSVDNFNVFVSLEKGDDIWNSILSLLKLFFFLFGTYNHAPFNAASYLECENAWIHVLSFNF